MKRAFDLGIVILLAPLLVVVLAVLAVLVRVRLGSPVFFTQIRPGLRGRPFRLIKLRSMTNARDASGRLLADGDRLTQVRNEPDGCLGLEDSAVLDQVAVTPTCGLAGSSPMWGREALAACRAVGRIVRDDESEGRGDDDE